MPIYEYECRNCGAISEFLTGVSQEEDPLVCRRCKSPDLEKMISRHNVGKSANECSGGCCASGGGQPPAGGCGGGCPSAGGCCGAF